MNKFINFNHFGSDHKLRVSFRQYVQGGKAIELMEEFTEDGQTWEEPYMTATVWVDGLKKDEIAIKNYSENEGILDKLIDEKIITKPHRFIRSGWVTIPVCRLAG